MPEGHNSGSQQLNECNSDDLLQKERKSDQPPDKLHREDQSPKDHKDDGHSHKGLGTGHEQYIQIQSSEKLIADDQQIKQLFGACHQPPKEVCTNYNPQYASDQQPKEFNADSQPPSKCNMDSQLPKEHTPDEVHVQERDDDQPHKELNADGQPPSNYNNDGQPPKEVDDQPLDELHAEKHSPEELHDRQPLAAHGQQPVDRKSGGQSLTEPKDNGQLPANLGQPSMKFVTNEQPPKELGIPHIDRELPKDLNINPHQPKELTGFGQPRDGLEKQMQVSWQRFCSWFIGLS